MREDRPSDARNLPRSFVSCRFISWPLRVERAWPCCNRDCKTKGQVAHLRLLIGLFIFHCVFLLTTLIHANGVGAIRWVCGWWMVVVVVVVKQSGDATTKYFQVMLEYVAKTPSNYSNRRNHRHGKPRVGTQLRQTALAVVAGCESRCLHQQPPPTPTTTSPPASPTICPLRPILTTEEMTDPNAL